MLKKVLIILFFSIFLYRCSSVDLDQSKSYSVTITNGETTNLGKISKEYTELNEGFSGFYPLKDGKGALHVRLHLAEMAQESIDLQYFLIKDDKAGAAITDALLRAADRGVRVRFLIDDVFTSFPDKSFFLLNQHSNIEIRVFNPVSRKGIKIFNFLGNFSKVDHRMHNKSFTVDNSMSIVGGRNIADEYFDLNKNSHFTDFDILTVGPVVTKVSNSFDRYWNHSLSVPADYLYDYSKKESLEEFKESLDSVYEEIYADLDGNQLKGPGETQFISATGVVISDDPDELMELIKDEEQQLSYELENILLKAKDEIIFFSPYYIPGDERVELIRSLTERGVGVIIVTNSLSSNNHIAAHSAYAAYREDIIDAGARLYEIKAYSQEDPENPEPITLHTKLLFIDRSHVFIGSANYDRRSLEVNAEMGILVNSKELVEMLTESLEDELKNKAYKVEKTKDGKLQWHSFNEGEKVTEEKEPSTSKWLRFKAWFMKIAPEKEM